MRTLMKYIYNDGGRSKYFKGKANDCVCRAISIASNRDYKEVYDSLKKALGTPRNGVFVLRIGWQPTDSYGHLVVVLE